MPEQMGVIEPCREFQAWRESQGLYGARYGTYLVRELGDLLSEPRIGEELYVELRFNAELRGEHEAMADRIGDIIAEASLAAKRDALSNGADHEAGPTDFLVPVIMRQIAAGEPLPRPLMETPEQRTAREWGLHPDEANPRAETWLHERKNWESEVENLRTFLRAREAQVEELQRLASPAPEQPAPPAEPTLPLSCGIPDCFLCAAAEKDASEAVGPLPAEEPAASYSFAPQDMARLYEQLASLEETLEACALAASEPIDEAMTCEPQEEPTVIPVEAEPGLSPAWGVCYPTTETEEPAAPEQTGGDWPLYD